MALAAAALNLRRPVWSSPCASCCSTLRWDSSNINRRRRLHRIAITRGSSHHPRQRRWCQRTRRRRRQCQRQHHRCRRSHPSIIAPIVTTPRNVISHAEPATSSAGMQSDHVAAFNACYESCTSHTCPGKSCVHSGCGFGDCSCHNRNASSCCEWCGNAVSSSDPVYQRCLSYWERSVAYCVMGCQDSCSKRGCV